MKTIKTLLFTLILALVLPVSLAAVNDSIKLISRSQVDSIVAVEVEEQMSVKLHDKMINMQSSHDTWIVGIVSCVFVVVGIVIPLLLNHRSENRMKNIEDRVNEANEIANQNKNAQEEIKRRVKEAEASAKRARLSELSTLAWNEKDFTKQIEIANQLIGEHPNDEYTAFAYYVRGTIYGNKSYYDNAISDLKKTISIDQDYANAYYCLGEYYFKRGRQGDDSEAKIYFEKAIEKNPNHAFSYKMLADVLLRMNQYQEALHQVNRAMEINAHESKIYHTLCKVHLELNNKDEALKKAKEGLNIAKESGDAYMIQMIEKFISDNSRTIQN